MTLRRSLQWTLLLSLGLLLGGSHAMAPRQPPPLRIATWNMEWLVAPETSRAARVACRTTRSATLPCDVARNLARDSADLARLAAYARRLDADVVALQEVESAAAARQVLPGYDFCLTTAAGVQQLGFAVRKGLAHECGPAIGAVSGSARGRPGMLLTLQVPGLPVIELLSLHLKSGCARDPLPGSSAACLMLTRQAAAVGEWIADRVAGNTAFIVLGDLNRGGLPDQDDAFWRTLDPDRFIAAAAHLPFSNCAFGDPYTDFIDHVLVSQNLAPWLAQPAFQRQVFRTADAARYRLSDHCPISVSLIRTGRR